MTPIQTMIKQVEDMIFSLPTTNAEQLQMVRILATQLLKQELLLLEESYYEGYHAGKKRDPDILGFLEKFEKENW